MQVKSARGEVIPCQELSGEEQEAKESGQGEPGEVTLFSKRDSGDGLDWGKRGLACDGAAREIDGDAAGDEDGGIGKENQPGQMDRSPGANVAIGGEIETEKAATHEVDRRKGKKQHEDGSHCHGEAEAGMAETVAVVGHEIARIIAVAAAMIASAATVRRQRRAIVPG